MYNQITNEIGEDAFYRDNFHNDGRRFVAWYLRRGGWHAQSGAMRVEDRRPRSHALRGRSGRVNGTAYLE